MVVVPTGYRLAKADCGRIVAAVEARLAEYPAAADLADGECWI
jgi:hypothetical protein